MMNGTPGLAESLCVGVGVWVGVGLLWACVTGWRPRPWGDR